MAPMAGTNNDLGKALKKLTKSSVVLIWGENNDLGKSQVAYTPSGLLAVEVASMTVKHLPNLPSAITACIKQTAVLCRAMKIAFI